MSSQYMQFYPGDYLRDTRHLSTEQHGAYLLLLMAMWSHEARLPNDPSKLARIAGVTLRRWRLISPEVMAFFEVDGDTIIQKRLFEEYQKAVSISGKRSVNGKSGGDAKALKTKEQALAKATDLPAVCQDTRARLPEPEPKPIGSSEKKENVTKVVAADAGSTTSKYAFEASTIRLTEQHLEAWKKANPHVPVESALWALDGWAGELKASGKNWFVAVASLLAKREGEALDRIHMARVNQEAAPRRQSMPDPAL